MVLHPLYTLQYDYFSNYGSFFYYKFFYYNMDKFEEAKSSIDDRGPKQDGVEVYKSEDFKVKKVIGKGTFGVVYLAMWKNVEEVAMKHVQINPKYKNRQIEILEQVKHPNIISLQYHFQSKEADKNYANIIMEYMPITISQVIKEGGTKNRKVNYADIITYTKGMLEGLAYLDSKNICHRDIKPSNILIHPEKKTLKICDFGSAKKLAKGEKSIVYICSRYYRAPQLIFQCTSYSTKVDMWSFACVVAELLMGRPMFDGSNTMDQLVKIIKVLGSPKKEDIIGMKIHEKNKINIIETQGTGLGTRIRKYLPNCPQNLIEFLKRILVYNPEKRLTAREALQSEIFVQKE